ncbi:universal stress protein [Halarchaeum nitratireducens]|uniref:Universal stress protein UspA n=1 Tax=Halarchaeum nitratireducens TaxID=489913 RepID=A0A830GE51_9EURY|nr:MULTISPECIES: universal stress protein [Halarchaeum]MBP2252386.1 nucleotide-binding universal stress UspA family protein [Halarchaeum solikamskense]GGN20447.1 universal stress protein UspA [Halarchaeum nitratireducens]
MYDEMLIPYDGSDEGEMGARHGIELAAELGSTVHALYVVDLPGVPRSLSLREDEEALREEYRKHGADTLAEVEALAAEHGVDCVTEMRSGSVSDKIISYAEDEEMDVIVMGSAYRGKLGNVLGGTTDKVVRSTTIPVVSKRMDADAR